MPYRNSERGYRMTRWKLNRERRLRTEKALQLLILSCIIRPADMEPRYRGHDRAHGCPPLITKASISKAGSGVPSHDSDKSSVDTLTEPDEACCAVGLEELRASSHTRTYAVIPFAQPISRPTVSLYHPETINPLDTFDIISEGKPPVLLPPQ